MRTDDLDTMTSTDWMSAKRLGYELCVSAKTITESSSYPSEQQKGVKKLRGFFVQHEPVQRSHQWDKTYEYRASHPTEGEVWYVVCDWVCGGAVVDRTTKDVERALKWGSRRNEGVPVVVYATTDPKPPKGVRLTERILERRSAYWTVAMDGRSG